MSPKKYFRTLQLIFKALLSGLLFFITIALALVLGNTTPTNQSLLYPLMGITVFLFINAVFTSKMLFKKKVEHAKSTKALDKKITTYTSAVIIRLAFIEATALFATVSYILTANTAFIGTAGILLVMFLLYFPKKEKVIAELELNYDQVSKME